MPSVDHLNIDGPPLAVNCVKNFGSALGGDITYVCVCVRARTYACIMCQGRTLCMYSPGQERTFDQEQTHAMSVVRFGIIGLIIFENPRIDHKIMVFRE